MATDTDDLILSISADTRQIRSALKQLGQDSKNTAKGIESSFNNIKTGNFGTDLSKNLKAAQNDAKVLSFQINDVVTGLLSGGKASQVFAQQAGQISQSFNGRGLVGSAQLLGQSIMSMINPINLAIAAFGLATVAAGKYFSETKDGSAETRKELQSQLAAIDAVVQRWGTAVPELAKIAAQTKATLEGMDLSDATQTAVEQQFKALKDGFADIQTLAAGVTRDMQDLGEVDLSDQLNADLKSLKERLDENKASGADVQKVLDDLKKSSLDAANPGVADLVAKLGEVIPAFDKAAKAAGNLNDQALRLLHTLNGFDNMGPFNLQLPDLHQLAPPTSEEIGLGFARNDAADLKAAAADVSQAAVQFIQARESFTAVARKDNDGKFRVGWWSDTIRDEAGNVKRVTEGMTTTLADANRDLVARIAEGQEQIKRAIGSDVWASLDENQKAALDSIAYNYGTLPDRIVKAFNEGGGREKIAKAISDLGTDNGGINAKRRDMEAKLFGGQDYTSGLKAQSVTLDDILAKSQRQIDLLTAQKEAYESTAQGANDYGYALAYAEERQRLLNEAAEHGITLSPDQIAAIEGVASAYARQTASVNELKDAQSQHAKTTQDARKEQQEFARQITGVAQSAVSGLVNDLRNGVSAGEVFRNMLDRVVDGLLNMAVQSLFSEKALGGLIGQLFGFGGGGQLGIAKAGGIGLYHTGGVAGSPSSRRTGVSPSVFLGAERYHSGGVAGLQAGEVPAILQKGEIIVPRLAAANASSSTNNNSVSFSVNAGGNASSDDLKQFAVIMKKQAEQLLVSEQRPGGLLNRRR